MGPAVHHRGDGIVEIDGVSACGGQGEKVIKGDDTFDFRLGQIQELRQFGNGFGRDASVNFLNPTEKFQKVRRLFFAFKNGFVDNCPC